MSINGLGVVSIDFNKQVDESGPGKTPLASSQTHATVKPGDEDTTSFTTDRQTVKSLSQAAVAEVPSRQARVEALRLAINSAQYQIDSDKISESLANAEV